MAAPYDVRAAERVVNLSLDEDRVRKVGALTDNASERVEGLLADYLIAESARRELTDQALDRAIRAWNAFGAAGSFADEHSTL